MNTLFMHIKSPALKRSGQNAILDRGMSTLLATVAVLAVLGAYYVYQASNDAQAAISQVNAVASTVKAMYGNASNTTDLVTNTIASSGNLPTAWISGANPNATIITPSRTPLTVTRWASTGAVPWDGFQITMTGLPNSTCIALLTAAYIGGHRVYQYGTGTASTTTWFLPNKPTPTDAQLLCVGNNSSVGLYFM